MKRGDRRAGKGIASRKRSVSSLLNTFGAKFQTTFVVCFFFFCFFFLNKLLLGKKSVDPDETTHYKPSHLDLCCLQK